MGKNVKVILAIAFIIIAIIGIYIMLPKNENQNENKNVKIVTSFYPIYVMAQNITDGANNIELNNLTQNNVGCLHDYTLSTSDMKKLEQADIFIENGLNLESFMEKIIATYPNLKIIDSSKQVTNLVNDNENVNPHIWTSIQNYIKQVEEITQKLCEYNPENSSIYTENSKNYIKTLEELKSQYDLELSNLKGKKAICLNEALAYFSNSLQMDYINVETNHEESILSADTIKNLINQIKKENIEIIFVGEEDNLKNAQTLESETNVKIYKLKTGMVGQFNKDEYLNIMKNNLEVIKQIN